MQSRNNLDPIREILTGNGRTLVQGALCWIWARSPQAIPIPGFRKRSQLEENIAALDYGPLDDKDMRAIEDLLS